MLFYGISKAFLVTTPLKLNSYICYFVLYDYLLLKYSSRTILSAIILRYGYLFFHHPSYKQIIQLQLLALQ